MRAYFILLFLISFSVLNFAQTPEVQWKETYGGINDDAFYSIVNAQGSFAVAGVFKDINNNSQSWIVSISDFGLDFWQRKFVWDGDNLFSDVALNNDWSYTVVGYTYERPRHRRDLFYMRLNSEGSNLGKQIMGGVKKDGATSVFALPDGGDVIYGYFTNGDVQNLWAIRANKHNTKLWEKEYNLSKTDEPVNVLLGKNKKLVFTSNRYSQLKKWDAYLVIADYATGNIVDTFPVGNNYNNWINDAVTTNDSAIVLCGYAEIQDKAKDFWLAKVDYSGNVIWEKNYGWSMNEEAYAVFERYNGNLLVCGYTESKGNGMYDFWVLELDSLGNQIWEKTIGTDANDIAYDLIETDDGGVIVVGSTFNGANKLDGCVLKLK